MSARAHLSPEGRAYLANLRLIGALALAPAERYASFKRRFAAAPKVTVSIASHTPGSDEPGSVRFRLVR